MIFVLVYPFLKLCGMLVICQRESELLDDFLKGARPSEGDISTGLLFSVSSVHEMIMPQLHDVQNSLFIIVHIES